MKNKKIIFSPFSVFFAIMVLLSHSHLIIAQGTDVIGGGTGTETDVGGTGSGAGEIRLIRNPLGDSEESRDPRKLIGRIIGAALGIVGSLALAIFVFGGFTWMTAAGNEDKVKKGRDMIVWAVFGLAVIFLSYVLVEFILGAFIL